MTSLGIPGAGRFGKIISRRDGNVVGVVATIRGRLVIVGLLTRFAAIPLITMMIVALISTTLPIRLDARCRVSISLGHQVHRLVQHDARAGLTMLLCSLYLLVVGAGRWSLAVLNQR